MTQNNLFSYPNSSSDQPCPSDDEDQDLSPSDGYFGGNHSIPDTVLVPSSAQPQIYPDDSSKPDEAAKDAAPHGQSDKQFATYTPATTHTPASSDQDSASAYNGSTGRYRDTDDTVSERSPLLEEPPPVYEDAVASRARSSNINGMASSSPASREGYETMQVRQPVSYLRAATFGGRQSPQSMVDPDRVVFGTRYDEESDPAILRSWRRRGCCGGRRVKREGSSRLKRFLSLLALAALALWLIVHLAQKNWEHQRHQNSPAYKDEKPPSSIPEQKRSFHQHEISNSISGTYRLYDLLDLSTVSGSIDVLIEPQPGTVPAVLRISSVSGSVNVKLDVKYFNPSSGGSSFSTIQNRTFETHISTQSGSVDGDLLHSNGGSTTIKTQSGGMNIRIYPIGHSVSDSIDEVESTISTSSNVGGMTVRIAGPSLPGQITKMVGKHSMAGSGSMNVHYPPQWEGGVHARSVGSGSVRVRGQGLQYDMRGSREVIGRRGNGETMVDIRGLGSGSIDFTC